MNVVVGRRAMAMWGHEIVFVASGVSAVRDAALVVCLSLRPGTLDVVEDSLDLGGGQSLPKAGHVTLVATANHRGGPIGDDCEELPVRMMPGVTGLVMRRRRKAAARARAAPVGLAFEFRAVTARTVR